jgi:hypothetical protein
VNVKHLDTLVELRGPEHQRLYDTIIRAVMKLELNDTLVDGDITVVKHVDHYEGYYIIYYKDNVKCCFKENISTRLYYLATRNMMRYPSLDGVCIRLLSGTYCMGLPEPWAVN